MIGSAVYFDSKTGQGIGLFKTTLKRFSIQKSADKTTSPGVTSTGGIDDLADRVGGDVEINGLVMIADTFTTKSGDDGNVLFYEIVFT